MSLKSLLWVFALPALLFSLLAEASPTQATLSFGETSQIAEPVVNVIDTEGDVEDTRPLQSTELFHPQQVEPSQLPREANVLDPAPPASAAEGSPSVRVRPQQEPFRPSGAFLSVGYGLHRYSLKTLSMEQDSSDRRTFDGGYFSLQTGYLAGWGGLIGIDWTHHSGKTNLHSAFADLSMRLRSDFVSLLTGIQLGGHVRFHFAILTGLAMSEFSRNIRVEETDGEKVSSRRDAHTSSPKGFLLGIDTGIVVMPTSWLAIGLRGRADTPLFSDDLSGVGGLYVGLTAAYVFSF